MFDCDSQRSTVHEMPAAEHDNISACCRHRRGNVRCPVTLRMLPVCLLILLSYLLRIDHTSALTWVPAVASVPLLLVFRTFLPTAVCTCTVDVAAFAEDRFTYRTQRRHPSDEPRKTVSQRARVV